MELTIINASPRKDGNTARLLAAFADGFTANGANTVKWFNLYDYAFSGCRSCFACKASKGKSYGKCAVKDEITVIFDTLNATDAILIGSPIYFASVPGQLHSFMERWLFPYSTYEAGYRSLWNRQVPIFTIYTMNATEQAAVSLQIPQAIGTVEAFISHVCGVVPTRQMIYDTYQFKDYSRYKVEVFSEESKRVVRDTLFPLELKKANANGMQLAETLG